MESVKWVKILRVRNFDALKWVWAKVNITQQEPKIPVNARNDEKSKEVGIKRGKNVALLGFIQKSGAKTALQPDTSIQTVVL